MVVLLLGLVFAVAVSASEDMGSSGGDSGGADAAAEAPAEEAHEEEAPKAKGKDKAKHAAAPAPAAADVPLEALSKLPVEPLSMDAAALKDDDRLFDQLPKQLSGSENVEQLTESLKKASALLSKMKRDVEAEKVWTKNVYDIIQNYQYKYLKTVKDVKMRDAKVAKMEKLVALLKQSTLHSAVERELSKASKALGELVTRAGNNGVTYTKITARMNKLKTALKTMPRPRELYSETSSKMQSVLRSDLPPSTSDALENLVNGHEAEAPAKPAAPAAAAAAKAPAKPAAKPAAAAKKPTAPAKPPAAKTGGKKAKATPKPKAKAAPKPKAKKQAKKPADDDE